MSDKEAGLAAQQLHVRFSPTDQEIPLLQASARLAQKLATSGMMVEEEGELENAHPSTAFLESVSQVHPSLSDPKLWGKEQFDSVVTDEVFELIDGFEKNIMFIHQSMGMSLSSAIRSALATSYMAGFYVGRTCN